MCVCVRAFFRVCMHVYVCERVCVRVCVCVCVCAQFRCLIIWPCNKKYFVPSDGDISYLIITVVLSVNDHLTTGRASSQ